ncbi:hypothetical protein AVEN_131435-1 [Araneus ventricosus]|uniref:Uncharacterized protein n=1 Tax=Araneus ventricosus TaxID=182803 RepID=A0A4Y2PQG6_ARAVE|nr:hypothetical protein AVEN_131435-1 [Araneus ventricosus]
MLFSGKLGGCLTSCRPDVGGIGRKSGALISNRLGSDVFQPKQDTTKKLPPPFRGSIRAQVKNGRGQQSETEVGILIANTSHGPTSSEGDTSRHRSGDNSTSYRYYAHQGSENPLTYPVASRP